MFIADTKTWYLERLIRLLAGIFVLGGTLLGHFVSPAWFIFTGLVGAMLMLFLDIPQNLLRSEDKVL